MKIIYDALFLRNLKKLSAFQRQLALEQLVFFSNSPDDPTFRDHPLSGRLSIYRAFSVDADIRILYRRVHSDCIKVVNIGPHTKVYKE